MNRGKHKSSAAGMQELKAAAGEGGDAELGGELGQVGLFPNLVLWDPHIRYPSFQQQSFRAYLVHFQQ